MKKMYLYTEFGRVFAKAQVLHTGIIVDVFTRKKTVSYKMGKHNPSLHIVNVRKSMDSRSIIATIYIHSSFYAKGDAFSVYINPLDMICANAANELLKF